MNLINENAGDHRPNEWDAISYMPEHERGLNRLRLQTVFGALNRQRAALRLAVAAMDRFEHGGMTPEEALHAFYLRDGLVGAYQGCEAALASLCDAAGDDTMIERQDLPDIGGLAEEPRVTEALPF